MLIVGVAAMWAVAYLALRPMPTWGVVILVVASLGWVREAYHLFRRSCLYAETLRYALTQGVSLDDAKAVAARYVDIRLPWGRRSADARRVETAKPRVVLGHADCRSVPTSDCAQGRPWRRPGRPPSPGPHNASPRRRVPRHRAASGAESARLRPKESESENYVCRCAISSRALAR